MGSASASTGAVRRLEVRQAHRESLGGASRRRIDSNLAHETMSGTVGMPGLQCGWCGAHHTGSCPRVKSLEFYPDGSVRRVEFHVVGDVPKVGSSLPVGGTFPKKRWSPE